MTESDLLPINFSISDRAKIEIGNMRKYYEEQFPSDPVVAVMIGWGLFHFNSGETGENVVVGFYQQSQLDDFAHGIQEVAGMKVVFFTIPKYHARFDGKVIEYAPERGFYLREP
ncbi:MAG: hypothetical protein P8Z80_03840 [Pseudolabrys sp.]|jgi:hypothetical protein